MNNVKSPVNYKIVAAILAMAFVSQLNTIASVMLADISVALNITDPNALQYVMQFGMIGGFPVSLAMTVLVRKFRRKPMMLIGLVFMIIGGLIPIINHSSLIILYVSAFLIGFGQGFLGALLGAAILASFEGDFRNRMIGLNTTFATGGATILLLIAGPLCNTGWVNVYYLYFLAVPVFLLALFFLPMDPKPQEIIAAETAASGGEKKAAIPGVAVVTCCISVVLMVAYVVFPLNVNLFVVAEGVGTAAETGLAMSLITVVGALVGIVLSQLIKAFKLYVTTVGAVAGFVATIIVIMSKDIVMVYVAAVIYGLYFGMVMSGGVYIISRICTPTQVGSTLSLSMAMVTLGTILSPIIINGITSVWTGLPVAEITPRNAFTTGAVVFAIGVVLIALWATYLTKKFPEKAPAQASASGN